MENNRETPIEIGREEFKKIGYHLIDTLSTLLKRLKKGLSLPENHPNNYRKLLGALPFPKTAHQREKYLIRHATYY